MTVYEEIAIGMIALLLIVAFSICLLLIGCLVVDCLFRR